MPVPPVLSLPVSHLSHPVRLYLSVSLCLSFMCQWPTSVSVIVVFFTVYTLSAIDLKVSLPR